jgi:hypothetical protein
MVTPNSAVWFHVLVTCANMSTQVHWRNRTTLTGQP